MTLIEITNYIKDSMEIKDDNSRELAIIKSYINEAYLLLSKVDKRLTRAYIPVVNGIATIPTNSIGIFKCEPELDKKDYIYGNSIVTSKTGVIEILYFYSRNIIVEDDEEFDLPEVLQLGIINYVCSMICKKNGEVSQGQAYYNAYMDNIDQFYPENTATIEGVVEVDY